MTKRLTIRVRTRHNLSELLEKGESPAWVVARSKEEQLTHVEVVNFDGDEMIVGVYDPLRSHRWENDRLVIAFTDARIVPCEVPFDGQNPVRYIEEAGQPPAAVDRLRRRGRPAHAAIVFPSRPRPLNGVALCR